MFIRVKPCLSYPIPRAHMPRREASVQAQRTREHRTRNESPPSQSSLAPCASLPSHPHPHEAEHLVQGPTVLYRTPGRSRRNTARMEYTAPHPLLSRVAGNQRQRTARTRPPVKLRLSSPTSQTLSQTQTVAPLAPMGRPTARAKSPNLLITVMWLEST